MTEDGPRRPGLTRPQMDKQPRWKRRQVGHTVRPKGAHVETVTRSRHELKRLQEEREEFPRSLRVSLSRFSRWTEAGVVEDLSVLSASEERIDEELEAEKGQLASLKDQISKLERTLAGQKTCLQTTQDSRKLVKNTCITESKLYRGRASLNKMMSGNRHLREDLKTLQEERKLFLQVQSHLERELDAIHKKILNFRTKSNKAFNGSVEIQERQRMLMNQNAKDVVHHIRARSDLEQENYYFYNLKVFLGIKETVRNNKDSDHRKVKHNQLESKELAPGYFEEAIKKILTKTKEVNLEELVTNFIEMEEQNYRLLTFVNYQHTEEGAIQRKISQLRKGSEILVAEEQQGQEQRHALWKKASVQQETTEQHLAAYRQRVEFIEKLLDQLKKGVKSLLRISCDGSGTSAQLGSSDGVQEENTVEYLIRVEKRVSELLTLQSLIHYQESLNPWDIDSLTTITEQLLGTSPPADHQPTAAGIPAPLLSDDPDLMESLLLEAKEPVSREDLLTLVKKRIQRRRKKTVRLT
ncbi:coiled-coil domain-containing protein 63-like isoform 2-T3 [Spinachia spinachia]